MTEADLSTACRSDRWVRLVASGLPYGSEAELLAAADQAFDALSEEDWQQAFAGCSRVGVLAPGDDHSVSEQAGVSGAGQELLRRLQAANGEYEDRFGFIFMIRATGRSAAEILDALERRLSNGRQQEFRNACGEQREIVKLRLSRVLALPAAGPTAPGPGDGPETA